MIPSSYFSTSVNEQVVHSPVSPLSAGMKPPKLPQDETKDDMLPPGFVSHIDPATGRIFYVNTTTGISQWWAPKPPLLPSLPPPPMLPPTPPPPEEEGNDFFSGQMTPMGINTMNGHAKENICLLLVKGRQYRTLYCFGWCALSALSYVGITSVCSLFSINSMFSIASINSVFSVGSVNRWFILPLLFPFLNLPLVIFFYHYSNPGFFFSFFLFFLTVSSP